MACRVMFRVIGLPLAFAILAMLAGCASVRTGQHPYSVQLKAGTLTEEMGYLLYLPAAYGRDRAAKWPLVLFLHGMGECGRNLQTLKKHPLPQMLETRKDFPFIVVSPQLDRPDWSRKLEQLNGLLLEIQARYAVDPRRVYVTGLSMGGGGTWRMALRYPRRFAAIVPIAGFYEYQARTLPPNLSDIRDLPAWVFHGAADTQVQLYQDEVLVEALKQVGSRVKFTVYEDAGHEDTWRRAYADPALYEWMLAQTLE